MIVLSAMDDDVPPGGAMKRHARFRKYGAYRTFADADAELRAYWHSRTPEERMEALEELRILNYGQAAIDARIPRVLACLNRAGVEYLLVGGYAVNHYGYHRFTEDIDFWIAILRSHIGFSMQSHSQLRFLAANFDETCSRTRILIRCEARRETRTMGNLQESGPARKTRPSSDGPHHR